MYSFLFLRKAEGPFGVWYLGEMVYFRIVVFLFSIISLSEHSYSHSSRIFNKDYDNLWDEFKTKFGKSYSMKENGIRGYIWRKNVAMINRHNLEADLGLHSYWLETNRFADWTDEEKHRLRGFREGKKNISDVKVFNFNYNFLPSHVDWREKGYVTDIKDQGDCGSCWAFSSTGALEGQVKAKSGTLISLSEQNLVDCSGKQGTEGCDGGWMDSAYDYVIQSGGIDTENKYPYKGQEGRCMFNVSEIGASCKSYVKVKNGNETELQAATAVVGPIAIAIDASGDKFTFYRNGVYNDTTCTSARLDHAVLVVGYGTQNNVDYWIVKNSWGVSWGMNGYILMSRNANNQCGIATHALFPVL